jgi:protein-S-isoprenylcysteine O-methyltransferase Ste14
VSGVKIVFGEIRETPRVITEGVFSFVRHPVYLGSILAFLGLIVMTLSLLSVIIWLIGIIFYYRISRYEERLLLSRFGKDYEDYMKKVPMLFPIRF